MLKEGRRGWDDDDDDEQGKPLGSGRLEFGMIKGRERRSHHGWLHYYKCFG